MTIPHINTDKLKTIIVQAAKSELLPYFANIAHTSKTDNSIVTAADIAAQENITHHLKENWPDIPLLGEEMSPAEQEHQLSTDEAVWCLDPLDGTSNFATGIPYFAISLALLCNDKAILGIVYDPIRDEYFQAQDLNNDLSVTLNDQPLKVQASARTLKSAMAIIDLKRLTKDMAASVASEPPYASQRNFGASALDWCWLAVNRCHIYLHGNQNIWDYAAGELIFRAAGGYSSTLQGEKVFKQILEKRSVVAAIDEKLFNEWFQWLEN